MDLATAGLHALEADRESETQPVVVDAPLFERPKQAFGLSRRQASALVLDVDENATVCRASSHGDTTMGTSELEGILDEVRDHRREDLVVGLDDDIVRTGLDR